MSMFQNSLESEVRDLRRAVESHGRGSDIMTDDNEGIAITLVIGFVIFLLII